MADVLVAGGGPAGWAIADQCARLGLRTVLVDPRPESPWRATYGMWRDECALLPMGSTWVEASVTRAAGRVLDRAYTVLDNESVRAAVAHPEVRVLADTVGPVRAGPRGCSVTLSSGRVLAAALVIDATGPRPASSPRAEQTAFGVVLPSEVAEPLVAPGEAIFMDWRGSDGTTFLYAVPLPGDRTLLEETSLARRPGMSLTELRTRLLARLAAHRIHHPYADRIQSAGPAHRIRRAADSGVGAVTEFVRIALDLPVPGRRAGVVPFGVAGGLVHPATGYSVAESFRLAPRVAEAIAGALGGGPGKAVRAGWGVVWSPRARVVWGLRRWGLAALLGMDGRVAEFFDIFFQLEPELQRRYLSEREDVRGTVAAMGAVFGAADWSTRARIAAVLINTRLAGEHLA
jgi:lycopene beta-cyclase